MTAFLSVDDYLDPDVAYLLGLITARGQFYEESGIRRLIINFPFRLFEAKPPKGSRLRFNLKKETQLCLNEVKNRINELLEVDVKFQATPSGAELSAVFTKRTMSWRNLTTQLKGRSSFREFEVPEIIYETPRDIQLEYIRGFADASATPTRADRDQRKFHRIVLQVNHDNWVLPIQLCKLLQTKLDVPVDHILWGHPNMGRGSREHRIRIFAEAFLPIGFHFDFKQQILDAMARINKKQRNKPLHLCNPLAKRIPKKKPAHKDEKSKTLPPSLRGKHFDAYFQICKAIGCEQGTPSDQLVLISEK
jgi:hypothetical protein